MKIFENEIKDGVSELVQAQCAVAYCTPIIISDQPKDSAFDKLLSKIKLKMLIQNKLICITLNLF